MSENYAAMPADIRKLRSHTKAVHKMVLEGRTTEEIAEHFNVRPDRAGIFLRARRPNWLADRNLGRIDFLDGKTVLYRKRHRSDGGYDIRPFSVPAISMHRAALENRP